MTKNLYIEIHALHTLPPSNVNRDDTGSPKSAIFGGVRRTRVSSQAWKRAIRDHFKESIDPNDSSFRTTRMVEKLAQYITELNPELQERAQEYAVEALKAVKIKVDKPRGSEEATAEVTGYLVFVSVQQLRAVAEHIVSAVTDDGKLELDKKTLLAHFRDKNSVDIALFGRMIADVPDMNVDASAQVAHALGVTRSEPEFDYFTATDDVKDEDLGAGMIGTVEFNSSTLYRYANVNVRTLSENLGDSTATIKAITQFLDSFIKSMPTGKQNTFANRTLPDGVVITVRSDQPTSLVGAFEAPVVPLPGQALSTAAATKLAEHVQEIAKAYGTTPDLTLTQGVGDVGEVFQGIGERHSLPELLSKVEEILTDRLPEL